MTKKEDVKIEDCFTEEMQGELLARSIINYREMEEDIINLMTKIKNQGQEIPDSLKNFQKTTIKRLRDFEKREQELYKQMMKEE